MEERGQKRDEQKRERRHAQQQQNNTILQEQHQLLMMDSTGIASESEETMAINTPTANMATTGKQQSSLSNNSASTQFSTFSSRMDDEDPIFTLDEEVHAKSGERTRHYTADFDPTVSDDDEFPKEIGNLHGGRAYSVSTRFPPRIRHSGRSGHLQNTTGIFHKLHGLAESAGGHPAAMVPASLPIQISRGFNWPPRELVGSLSEEEESGGHQAADKTGGGGGNIPEAATERGRAKTAVNPMVTSELAAADNGGHHQMGQQQHGSEREEDGNLYGRMQAYSRSIQRVDDPERIFGERPHRRFSMIIKNSGGGPASDEAGDHQQQDDGSGGENIPPAAPFEGGPPHHHAQPPSTTSLAHHHPTISSSSSTSIPAPTGRTGTAIGGGATPRVIVPASLRG